MAICLNCVAVKSGISFGEMAMVADSMASELIELYGELSSLVSLMGRV